MATLACCSAAATPVARTPSSRASTRSTSESFTGTPSRREVILGVATVALGSARFAAAFPPAAFAEEPSFEKYYGTAASASSYGGYGGNASKTDTAEYIFDVPQGWKERLITKVEKGTNGTDSEFYNPKKKTEKTYLTFLAGFRNLASPENVLNNLSLSDVNLQDDLAQAESIKSTDRKDDSGQVYYEYEIETPVAHSLITVTCAKNKLYAHFVKAPAQDWKRDEDMLRHIHTSFTTVGSS